LPDDPHRRHVQLKYATIVRAHQTLLIVEIAKRCGAAILETRIIASPEELERRVTPLLEPSVQIYRQAGAASGRKFQIKHILQHRLRRAAYGRARSADPVCAAAVLSTRYFQNPKIRMTSGPEAGSSITERILDRGSAHDGPPLRLTKLNVNGVFR
jgi:hypothetical protein